MSVAAKSHAIITVDYKSKVATTVIATVFQDVLRSFKRNDCGVAMLSTGVGGATTKSAR